MLDFGTWIRQKIGCRVQKLAVDAGFSCPNRDGRLSLGGCTFCNNEAFNTSYCDRRKSVTEQLEDGKRFFNRKKTGMKYLAYFQAYSNTYAPMPRLKALYEEALSVDDVVGIVIGTRPDCVNDEILDYLEELSHRTFVLVEYGVESCNDETLRRINRSHDFACSRKAIEETHRRGIYTCAHIILGLPGESREEMLHQADIVSSLPIDVLKLHQLQIIMGTSMAREYEQHPFHTFSLEEYVDLLADYLPRLRPDIALERFVSESPSRLLIAPRWGVKPQKVTMMVMEKLHQKQ
ncbi:MAG: TIGR01212 family radical SAM protein [Prevotella sp.]|jgi:radical SAM protein (TIGR01212 family)